MISLKYRIPKLEFEKKPIGSQTYKVYIKKENEGYNLVTNEFITDKNGNNTNNFVFKNLNDDTNYSIKLVNSEDEQSVYEYHFKTNKSMEMGDNPYVNKRYFIGQSIDFYEDGLTDLSLPNLNGGFFFNFDNNYREIKQNYSNMIPSEGTTFKKVTDSDIPTRDLNGLYFDGRNTVTFNNIANSEYQRITADTLFGINSNKEFCIYFYIFLENQDDKTILYTENDSENSFLIELKDKNIVITMKANNNVMTATSKYNLEANKVYMFEMKVNTSDANKNSGFIYHPNGNFSIDGLNTFTSIMKTTAKPKITIGKESSKGFVLSRFYFAPIRNISNSDLYKLSDFWSYIPKVCLEKNGVEKIVPNNFIGKLDNTKITFILDKSFISEEGRYNIYIKDSNGGKYHEVKNVEVINFSKDSTGFDIDFNEGNFEDKIIEFKNTFYAFHSQWGGANGGVNGDLIYFSPQNKSVIFETHGDKYDGEVVGVSKPAKDKTFTGYGVKKIHDIPQDPKYREDWKTRVGAVAVTKNYCGYGEWSTYMKIPKESYGYCPALWFFHYMEIYPTNPDWQKWIDKGGKPYGGNDPYMVINNEIDIELPSHLYQMIFADWEELRLAYFDPKAIDSHFRIVIEGEGLYVCNNPTEPNKKESWTFESNTYQSYNTPSFDHCKFNNWIGEKASGSGVAYDRQSYLDAEEYCAKLTKLSENYADDKFHKWTIKWYKDRTELWIDDVKIRDNRAFVPYIPGRLTFGTWFPSGVKQNAEKHWEYSPERAWAGYPANFDILHVEINRISFRPFSDLEAGGENEMFSETFPESGLRIFK